MSNLYRNIFLTLIIFLTLTAGVYAEEKKPKGPPPAMVVVSTINSGKIAPDAEFIGTVYYREVSEVASEVSGKVKTVNFEEGDRVKSGDLLLKIDSAILGKEIKARKASREEVGAELENARLDLKRAEGLHSEELLSDKDYDRYTFEVKGLEKKALAMDAEIERLEIELRKKSVVAPFSGVILKRHADRGEWLSPGAPVAVVAYDAIVDVVVNVPQGAVPFIRPGAPVTVTSGKKALKGKVFAVIPGGDIATRTFPVKIRLKNKNRLKEGMDAKARLPVGAKMKALLVNRDALIPVFGQTVVYAVIDSKAVMFPVKVIGYAGMKAGIKAKGLKEGMMVVVKGNERLQGGGQRVIITNKKRR